MCFMTLKRYLNKYLRHPSLTIVGPLAKGTVRGSFIDPVIFVDGGARFRGKAGFSVGDGDSGSRLDQKLPAQKNYSDLAFVLGQIPKHFNKITLTGFSGGRKDHDVINLGEIFLFLKRRSRTEVVIDEKLLAFPKGRF